MNGTTGSRGIEHVFVLMLENRSFDHMLGFSYITGTDAATGKPTTTNGLTGSESNDYGSNTYKVNPGASRVMPADPPHDFPNVLDNFCGPTAKYPKGGPYPPINNSGFVDSYARSSSVAGAAPGEVMKCFGSDQLPVLNALAREFVICDNWLASMPGPTWPNRMFLHAASSNGLDHTPSNAELVEWETFGYGFKNGTIFDRLKAKGIRRRLYAGDHFPMVAALKGIGVFDIRPYDDQNHYFVNDLKADSYPYTYVFIEPSYDVLHEYKAGSSQHPLADVHAGEQLIKTTYDAIRQSKFWNSSLLIVTYDEHGGFYDHARPSAKAAPPGDTVPGSRYNTYGYAFQDYGPRVPAIVASPLIPKNLIDHRLYDHASVPKTLEDLFGMSPMTARDAAAAPLSSLITLTTPRTDTPGSMPNPAAMPAMALTARAAVETPVTRPMDPVDDGILPGAIHSALHQDLEISPPAERKAILARVGAIKTRGDAMQYLQEVGQKIEKARAQ
jgi:phospholipase C